MTHKYNCKICGGGEIECLKFKQSILKLEKAIVPPLSACGIDIEEYSEKLIHKAEILALTIQQDIVGISAFYANDFIKEAAFLSFLAVDQKIKRQGWGRQLLCKSEQRAEYLGMKKMRLEVFCSNVCAIKFYSKMGYVKCGMASGHSIYMIKSIESELK